MQVFTAERREKKALLTSIKVAPLLKKGPLTYDNTMATELYEELQLPYGINKKQPDFTDGKIFTKKTATTPLCLGPIGVVCMSCKVYFYVL